MEIPIINSITSFMKVFIHYTTQQCFCLSQVHQLKTEALRHQQNKIQRSLDLDIWWWWCWVGVCLESAGAKPPPGRLVTINCWLAPRLPEVCCNKTPRRSQYKQQPNIAVQLKSRGSNFQPVNKPGLPNKLWLVNFYCGPLGWWGDLQERPTVMGFRLTVTPPVTARDNNPEHQATHQQLYLSSSTI